MDTARHIYAGLVGPQGRSVIRAGVIKGVVPAARLPFSTDILRLQVTYDIRVCMNKPDLSNVDLFDKERGWHLTVFLTQAVVESRCGNVSPFALTASELA